MVEQYIIGQLEKINSIEKDTAISKDMCGLKIFDRPLFGYAAAHDPLFKNFRDIPEATYGNFIPPEDWLSTAETVISVFFPYSEEITAGNSRNMEYPSSEWLHGRHEGQEIIDNCTEYAALQLIKQGHKALAPSIHDQYRSSIGTWLDLKREPVNSDYYSNWSKGIQHLHAVSVHSVYLKRLLQRKELPEDFPAL